jgi:hypothetical protein
MSLVKSFYSKTKIMHANQNDEEDRSGLMEPV